MKLSKKLKEWQRENVIDSTVADRISQYEKQRSKPLILWAVGGMGTFTIIVGFISVIAANWMHTPDWLKLSVDLVACLVIAVALYRTINRESSKAEKPWLREILVIFYYGFTLASMALIGQTYQLGGSLAKLFLVWTVATIPLVLLGRGKFLAVLWLFGSATTYLLNVESLHDFIRTLTDSSHLTMAIFVSLYLLGPMLFILISRIPWLVRERPVAAGEISRFSWLAIIVFGWMCQFLWYEGAIYDYGEVSGYVIAICFIATAVMVYFIPALYSGEHHDTHLSMCVVMATVFLLGATAVWHRYNLELVGALSNLLYLSVLAWVALKIKSTTLFNAVTALICLRIVVIYFEVFGSMLETGIGLIIGGALTLSIAWWWFKKSDTLAQQFSLHGGQ
jgi:uncharacterized membrane protein